MLRQLRDISVGHKLRLRVGPLGRLSRGLILDLSLN